MCSRARQLATRLTGMGKGGKGKGGGMGKGKVGPPGKGPGKKGAGKGTLSKTAGRRSQHQHKTISATHQGTNASSIVCQHSRPPPRWHLSGGRRLAPCATARVARSAGRAKPGPTSRPTRSPSPNHFPIAPVLLAHPPPFNLPVLPLPSLPFAARLWLPHGSV